jgi:hypothetical protein
MMTAHFRITVIIFINYNVSSVFIVLHLCMKSYIDVNIKTGYVFDWYRCVVVYTGEAELLRNMRSVLMTRGHTPDIQNVRPTQ